MNALRRRLAALEGKGTTPLSHLSDEALKARLVACSESIVALGCAAPDGWREAVEVGDVGFLSRWIAAEREALCQA